MNMNDLIKDFCFAYDYEFYDGYSGRFMYGRKCPGIVCDDPMNTLLDLMVYLGDEAPGNLYDAREKLGNAKMDNMGLSRIIYFPAVLSDEVEADEE